MKWIAAAAAALVLCCVTAPVAAGLSPLNDPGFLNIGLSCRWENRCMSVQRKAMKRALGYVRKYQPPTWRIQLCNRNAARGYQRVDWIGFDHCIRNEALRPPPPPPPRPRARPRRVVHHRR
jgi:hypothetical protein